MPNFISEDDIEVAMVQRLEHLYGYDSLNCYTSDPTELKKALMHKLFTEGLRNEPQKQTEIGPVPESWEVAKVGDFAKIQSGGTPTRDVAENWIGCTRNGKNASRHPQEDGSRVEKEKVIHKNPSFRWIFICKYIS